MSSFIDKTKAKAQELVEHAKPVAGKAKDQAGDLVDKAKPMAEKAKDQAGDLVDKARPMAADAVDKVSGGINKVTGHRYTEKIEGVSDKVEGALRGKPKAGPEVTDVADVPDVTEVTNVVDAEIVPDDPAAPGDGPGA